MSMIYLTGCGSDSVKEQGTAENEVDDIPKEEPQLPNTGRQLADFIPEGWELLDSVELDFNEDGCPDYVAVLQDTSMDISHPENFLWILFAVQSDEKEGYCLNFQDSSLIRNYRVTLTAEEMAFTIHTEYGTMLRWSLDHPNDSRGTDDDTYTYRDGNWWHTLSESTYGYGDYITEYRKDDWESGVGIRKRRSSEFEDIEKNYEFGEYENQESIEYDVVYEVALDEPLTLEQISKQRELSPYYVTEWEVDEITFAADVALSEDMVKPPNDLQLYKGKIYYSAEIVEEEAVVGIRLGRMNPDGTGKETIFTYRYPETESEISENELPYIGLYYEIGGDEIVVNVHIGNEQPDLIYRMKTDGSRREQIGQIPRE
ncbi:MAG: hypothetical protein K2N43_06445 [Lachnospiraceae bacterium]|nr:hypothetical protein [Lachnospiraceae bacterium]